MSRVSYLDKLLDGADMTTPRVIRHHYPRVIAGLTTPRVIAGLTRNLSGARA